MQKNTKLMLLVVLATSFFLTGCASWTTIKETPPMAGSLSDSAWIRQIEAVPAYFVDCQVKSNGTEVNTSGDFVNRIVGKLNRTQLFSVAKSGYPERSSQEDSVKLSLSVNEWQDAHQGAAFVKGLFIGASLFILTPVLPLRYDFSSDMELLVTRWDGETKRYNAKSSGKAMFHLFASGSLAGQELRGEITTNNLNSLLNQMMADATFYRAVQSSIPRNNAIQE